MKTKRRDSKRLRKQKTYIHLNVSRIYFCCLLYIWNKISTFIRIYHFDVHNPNIHWNNVMVFDEWSVVIEIMVICFCFIGRSVDDC